MPNSETEGLSQPPNSPCTYLHLGAPVSPHPPLKVWQNLGSAADALGTGVVMLWYAPRRRSPITSGRPTGAGAGSPARET